MLVVISDLHFEEEACDGLDGWTPAPRNLPARGYQNVIGYLAADARRNGVRDLDLVLAGDIFDLHRTLLWFDPRAGDPALRPYVRGSDVREGSPLEAKIMRILESICAEESVAETLEIFRGLHQNGKYRRDDDVEDDFPRPVRLSYLPGNHDRLVNATPGIRALVRDKLGLEGGGDPFPHVYRSDDPRVLVRHGHEYDPYNFSFDWSSSEEIPSAIPDVQYSDPCFGDFVTVEIAARLVKTFRDVHDAKRIRDDALLLRLYDRLLQFDDVRPQSALLDFLLDLPEHHDRDGIWRVLRPVAKQLLDDIADHPFLREQLAHLDRSWRPDGIDAIQALFRTKAWRLWSKGPPLGLIERVSRHFVGGRGGPQPQELAAREAAIQRGEVRFVVAGHTHEPQVALATVNARPGGQSTEERYFLDTGTWRRRIPRTLDRRAFGSIKTQTYVVLYGNDEDRGDLPPGQPKLESFDTWTGHTERWRA